MSEVAQKLDTSETDDPEIVLCARMMRAALLSLPAAKRKAALEILNKENPSRAPQRGGETLNKVVRLFKDDCRPEWTAEQVLDELEKRGESAERKSVYNALTYLSSNEDVGRRVLRKVGYGRYQMADGSWREGPP